VDTGIVLRRLEQFFAELPERERLVIESYLGVGLTPVEVAKSLKVTPSRVSQIYHSVVRKAAAHFAEPPRQRALDRYPDKQSEAFQELIAQRERELARSPAGSWGELMEKVLSRAPVDPVTDA
jgi:RNA polymerase sigma factor for flagellar operon FliA